MKILIIGASGLVGSNCLNYFRQQTSVQVVGTYYGYPTADTVFYDTLDPENAENFKVADLEPDYIVHCGALTHVDYCEDHPQESYEKTVSSTANVLKLCRQLQAKPVFISTDYVFDGKHGPYAETDTVNPLSVYARHKLEAETMVREQFPGGLILRITNVYGDEERGKNFVSRILSQILEGATLELRLPHDQYATPVNAADIARAMYLLITDGKQGIYHIAGTDYMNRVQLAQGILKYFKEAKYHLQAVPTSALGQAAERPLQGGLKTAKFLAEYPDFQFSNLDDYIRQKISGA